MDESLPKKAARIRREEGLASVVLRGTKAVLRRIGGRPIGMFYFAYIKGDLTAEKKRRATAASTVEFAFHGLGEFIRPLQYRDEMIRLAELTETLGPKVVVEIGTASGGTLFMFTRLAAPDALIVSIDLPRGEYGGGYALWRSVIYRDFAAPGQHIELMRANSHDPATLAALERILDGRRIDLLFIDGDHTYEGVKRDYETFSPLVRQGGAVAFHDIAEHAPELNCHVDLFWNEVKQGKRSQEFITSSEAPGEGGAGIGVIFVG